MLRKANTLRPNDGYIIDSLGLGLVQIKKLQGSKKALSN